MPAPGLKHIEQPSPDILFFPFLDGGLLFRKGSRRIWVLNPASAFIWCLSANTVDVSALARQYAHTFAVTHARALGDVQWALAGFLREGLLGESITEETEPAAGDGDIKALGPYLELRAEGSWPFKRCFHLDPHRLELCCQDESMGRVFGAIMEPLSADCVDEPDTCMVVVSGAIDQTWDIYLDGRRWIESVSREEVLPYLVTLTFIRFSKALHNRLLFHAAVLGKEGKVILLPGEAGSGKTTLASALVARRGLTFFSDELAVLDVATLAVTPFLLPMSIKPGSVSTLSVDYPEIAGAQIHPRSDGKEVRYLLPSQASLPSAGGVGEIQCIVFPTYGAEATNGLTLLEKGHAMQRLVRTGSSNRELTGADISAMIALVEKVPCYDLVFSALDDAVEGIGKLIAW